MLYGRDAELGEVDNLLAGAGDGRSGVLVIRGAAGIGKSALLEYAAAQAQRTGAFRVLRSVAVESEMELPFAGLHLLLRPAVDRIGALPRRQAAAIRGAFGLTDADGADPFLVGVAVLNLLSELADDGPLLCVVDDAQWLDHASAAALTFAARRLDAEGVAVIFAVRDDGPEAGPDGLPELHLDALDRAAARALLAATALPAATVERILDEAGGNPLALLELPAALLAEQVEDPPGPLALHIGAATPPGRVQAAFERQIQRLPAATQSLLVVAAADDRGDLTVVLRAARSFGAHLSDLEPAERGRLVEVAGGVLTFRHPLVRAAAYRSATAVRRLGAHRALAAVLDSAEVADQRAWHLAAATTEPDEDVAAELERCAERARDRAGYAAVAVAYERAAELTPDTAVRATRLVAAARAAADAGRLDRAEDLASRAGAATHEPLTLVHLAQVRAWAEFERRSARVASGIYLEGAARAGGQAPDVAVPMLVEAALASWRYVRDPRLLERAVDLVPDLPPDSPLTPFVSAVRGLTRFRSGDLAAAFPLLRVAVRDLRQERLDVPRALMVGLLCVSIGDYAALEEVAEQAVAQCRRYGMVGRLVVALRILAVARVAGRARYDEAETMLAEALQLAVDTGQHRTVNQIQSGQVMVAALTGDEHQCRTLAEQSIAAATAHDDNVAAAIADWSVGLLDLGSGRYEQALTRLQRIDPRGHSFAVQFGGDLVEAAARAGRPELGADALAHVEEWAACSGEAWIRAVALRSQALVSSDEDAGGLYAAATGVAGEAGQPYEQARTDLVYGEWLRRARRRADARVRLRAAVEVFDRIGAAPWAGRARLELRATGETPAAGEPAPRLLTRLTPQERQVVVRAAAGASNREIAAELFLSHRTVGYHLYKAYPKLGITSRTELVRIAAAWSSD